MQSAGRLAAALLLAGVMGVGCAARAAPMHVALVVELAGPGSGLKPSQACTMAMRPAFRQGVNCQVLLQCGQKDLFGGRRIGGYAVCDYEDNAFLSALDDKPRDGDPALRVDVRAGRVRWQDREENQYATLQFAGAVQPGTGNAWGDEQP